MDLETQTLKNSQDISNLTITVNKLATMFEYAEKSRAEERLDVKAAVGELRALNEKISSMSNMQKEIADLTSETRTLRHDLRNLDSGMDAIPIIKQELDKVGKDVVAIQTQIVNFKEWKDKHDGAANAVRTGADWFWRLFGPAISALAVAGCAWYFSQQANYSKSSSYIERGPASAITGE